MEHEYLGIHSHFRGDARSPNPSRSVPSDLDHPDGVIPIQRSDSVEGAQRLVEAEARGEEVDRGAIDAWEGEGGSADSRLRHETGAQIGWNGSPLLTV